MFKVTTNNCDVLLKILLELLALLLFSIMLYVSGWFVCLFKLCFCAAEEAQKIDGSAKAAGGDDAEVAHLLH